MEEKRSYLAGGGIAVLFGTSFLASKMALNIFSQPALLAWRFTLAAAALWLLGKVGVVPVSLKGKPWHRLLGISLVYPILSYTFEMKGVSLVPSSQAGVIISLMPIMALLLGAVFLGEHPGKYQIFMVLLSVAGVVVITFCSGSVETGDSLLGIVMLLCDALCGAGQAVLIRSQKGRFTSLEITYVMNIAAAVYFICQVFVLHGSYAARELLEPVMRLEGILPVLYLGWGCSIGAMFCLNYINAHLEVARAAVFTNLSTIVSVLAGVFLGHEVLNAGQLGGMLMIIIGVWGVNHFAGHKEDVHGITPEGT